MGGVGNPELTLARSPCRSATGQVGRCIYTKSPRSFGVSTERATIRLRLLVHGEGAAGQCSDGQGDGALSAAADGWGGRGGHVGVEVGELSDGGAADGALHFDEAFL